MRTNLRSLCLVLAAFVFVTTIVFALRFHGSSTDAETRWQLAEFSAETTALPPAAAVEVFLASLADTCQVDMEVSGETILVAFSCP